MTNVLWVYNLSDNLKDFSFILFGDTYSMVITLQYGDDCR